MRPLPNRDHNYGQPIPEPPQAKHQLWISGQPFADDHIQLQKCGIIAVCSLTDDPFSFPEHIAHLQLQIEDRIDEEISQHFDTTYKFIEEHRQKGNVLVHCMAGVSRSATICTYYLMRKWRWGAELSLSAVRSGRPFVRPNDGFYRELRRAEVELGMVFGRARF